MHHSRAAKTHFNYTKWSWKGSYRQRKRSERQNICRRKRKKLKINEIKTTIHWWSSKCRRNSIGSSKFGFNFRVGMPTQTCFGQRLELKTAAVSSVLPFVQSSFSFFFFFLLLLLMPGLFIETLTKYGVNSTLINFRWHHKSFLRIFLLNFFAHRTWITSATTKIVPLFFCC